MLAEYLLEVPEANWSTLLKSWARRLPSEFTVWFANRFGDTFIVLRDGTVHMLDLGAGTLSSLSASRDAFASALDDEENRRQWLMTPLVDELTRRGVLLKPGYCYGFTTPPVLGGAYAAENVTPLPVHEVFEVAATIHEQIAELPDGAKVRLKVTD